MEGRTLSGEVARKLYEALVRARRFDEKVAALYPEKEMKCPVHLSLGQEGSAAGVCSVLDTTDKIWSTHRCHAHSIAKGGDFKLMFAELYGKVTGASRGKGGSMHFVQPEIGIMGASAIVGASLPLALGSALASKLRKQKEVSVAFFGDGAVEQGTFHEGMNFAALHSLPIVIVVENNRLATATPIEKRHVQHQLSRYAEPYGMPGITVDGRHPEEVYFAAKEAVRRARNGEGPTLIEVLCERWSEHVIRQTNAAPLAVGEGKEDPVKNFSKYAIAAGSLKETEVADIDARVDREIEEAVAFAKASPFPDVSELYLHV